MSDCSGIKTYMIPEDVYVSKYIDLTEKTDDERIQEFVRTIEYAIDSLKNKKYGIQIFTDIICVAHNNVSDIFEEENHNYGDCVITSPYIVLAEEEIYLTFAATVISSLNKYKEKTIDINGLYNQINNARRTLKYSLEFESKQKTKTNIK